MTSVTRHSQIQIRTDNLYQLPILKVRNFRIPELNFSLLIFFLKTRMALVGPSAAADAF